MGFQTEDLEDENEALKKEVAALRRALKSHGKIVEENRDLKIKVSILESRIEQMKIEGVKPKFVKSR